MKTIVKALIFFLLISISSSILINVFKVPFGYANFWDYHGLFFLIFITMFPRLTLLFSSVPFGGVFWWIGWFFAPRLLVAILATINYWHSNKVLVVISWLVCIGGESSEKTIIRQKTRSRYMGDVIDV
ncbi:MAG: hypothetical protein R3B45_09485 [Bdellovibrionota bacterium]